MPPASSVPYVSSVPSVPPHIAKLIIRDTSRFLVSTPLPVAQASAKMADVIATLHDLSRVVTDWMRRLEEKEFPDPTDRIIHVVAREFLVTSDAIRSKARPANVALARQLCMAIAYQLHRSATVTGRRFDRDHGCVLHALRVVRNRVQTDTLFRDCASRVSQRLGITLPFLP